MNPIKKIISLMLVVTLLLSTVGIVHFAHYCGDDFKGTSFIANPSCSCGDEDTADDCCKSEVNVSQLNSECIYAEKASLVNPIIAPAFFTLNMSSTKNTLFTTTNLSWVLNLRDKLHDPPLYLKNSLFLI